MPLTPSLFNFFSDNRYNEGTQRIENEVNEMKDNYFSSDEMQTIDRYTIEEIGIPSAVLMERAAYSLVLDLQKKLEKDDNIRIVAGSGNNGADAIAVARMLHLLDYSVQLFLPNTKRLSEGMHLQLHIAQNINIPIVYEFDQQWFEKADFIVDGLFGIGLSREMEGIYQKIARQINSAKSSATVIAVDIPSGLSASTGSAFSDVIHADYTYTFGYFKKGMNTEEGKEVCGEIILCDIGYPNEQLKNHFIDINQ